MLAARQAKLFHCFSLPCALRPAAALHKVPAPVLRGKRACSTAARRDCSVPGTEVTVFSGPVSVLKAEAQVPGLGSADVPGT